ncbi:coiled-coil domain-containing protein 24 [Enoplosus armatus]|uniref:coiled-coil domain-containing protein 24 n=1 Tax=Enoplosus armatus TaxID=215367 RepID=UPI003996AF26
MQSPDGNQLWCPSQSLWSLIAEHAPGSELPKIRTVLGDSLVDMYTEVHSEAEMWHKMWQESQQGNNSSRAGTPLPRQQGSPLADPPAIKELVRAEVKMLLQTLRERASRGGRDGEELLFRYKPETVDYALSHLDSCYRNCTNREDTDNGSRPSSHCSVQSNAEDEIDAMRDKLNVTDIDQVVNRLKSVLLEECEALSRLVKLLKGNIKQKRQSRSEFDQSEPSLAELRELRGAIQMDLQLYPSSFAASPSASSLLSLRELNNTFRRPLEGTTSQPKSVQEEQTDMELINKFYKPVPPARMGAIFNILEQFRLESYYNQFFQLGVKDERDFLDGITDEDLNSIGLSHVEKNRFSAMKNFIQRLRAPARQVQTVTPVLKSLELFSLQYTYPKCPQPKHIRDMDPAQNTVEDLMLQIGHLESVGNSRGVCLYTVDGMPLTDDPFFNTWSLKDRHIQSGAVIYAIFTPKENLKQAPQIPQREVGETFGNDVVRCHIMLKGDFEVMVNLASDTITSLRLKLANESGIPAHVLYYKGQHSGGDTLQSCGISERSTVAFSLSTFSDETTHDETFFINDFVPSVQQTQKGVSVFLSSLYAIKHHNKTEQLEKLISYIRKLTGCNPLAQSLHQLLCRNERLTRIQKIAVVEGLFILFRELLPQRGRRQGEKRIDDLDVFENSLHCWAHLLTEAKKQASDCENYAPITLTSEDGSRFCEPVRVPGVPGVFERECVLQKIKA